MAAKFCGWLWLAISMASNLFWLLCNGTGQYLSRWLKNAASVNSMCLCVTYGNVSGWPVCLGWLAHRAKHMLKHFWKWWLFCCYFVLYSIQWQLFHYKYCWWHWCCAVFSDGICWLVTLPFHSFWWQFSIWYIQMLFSIYFIFNITDWPIHWWRQYVTFLYSILAGSEKYYQLSILYSAEACAWPNWKWLSIIKYCDLRLEEVF